MVKKRSNTRFMAEVAVFSALAYLLDLAANILSLKIWPQGGSISIAMVPVFLIAYRWGIKGGLLTGFLLGLLQFIIGFAQIYTILQAIIDYFIAFTVVGFAGVFAGSVRKAIESGDKSKWMVYVVVGIFVGSLLRYFCHVISGIVFFGEYAPEGQPVAVYSLLYNGTYMLPSFIISAIIVVLVIAAMPKRMVVQEH
ncbi:energy-coupled thiamine transporter ThiT [Neobacillus thermocopriae]|uniref:Energy-coupled thiamine transporter ThiT n=1 Tax=Neobacillus thermocopriae TaxID=1215031 RepID=A0A6B3TQL7_9BACI|nr:energy-coupled thiamine transporter ThiT [Neobacillus thermocopriae]MED3623006.1 energy-coupled thiamine transporter ThiT [Neobacillus thermocopriae]MED3714901.1 energy-coupled thiamine transporter ThiT [Neobacillus thermocopriae]NEX79295.1 energy-coupled thiamine transporter ThiT [Neobacillus thermocopriae]